MSLDSNAAVVLAAFAIGAIFGALARWSGFCMRGAVEDGLNLPEAPRLLVLAAGGNLRAIVSFMVFALVAYATVRGILAPPRSLLMLATSAALGDRTLPLAIGSVFAAAATMFSVRHRVPARYLVAGALIGLLVPAGYLVTTALGGDDFDPSMVESINVTRAGGDALVYLLIWTGAKLNFGIAFVGGIVAGAAAIVGAQGDFKLVGFERPVDMLCHALGGAMMGIGGVLALGCTIGND